MDSPALPVDDDLQIVTAKAVISTLYQAARRTEKNIGLVLHGSHHFIIVSNVKAVAFHIEQLNAVRGKVIGQHSRGNFLITRYNRKRIIPDILIPGIVT